MPFYRFYLLTAQDRIAGRQEATCDDDASALATAADVIGTFPAVEVWDGRRRVARLAAEDIRGFNNVVSDATQDARVSAT